MPFFVDLVVMVTVTLGTYILLVWIGLKWVASKLEPRDSHPTNEEIVFILATVLLIVVHPIETRLLSVVGTVARSILDL